MYYKSVILYFLSLPGRHVCPDCGKEYTLKHNLHRHIRLECNKEPQFSCKFCEYRAKQKSKLKYHLFCKHGQVNAEDIV